MGGVVSGIVGLFKKPKAPKIPAAPPLATRNAAQEAALREDRMRRRRGVRANDVTGGAEAASPGGKTLLGQ